MLNLFLQACTLLYIFVSYFQKHTNCVSKKKCMGFPQNIRECLRKAVEYCGKLNWEIYPEIARLTLTAVWGDPDQRPRTCTSLSVESYLGLYSHTVMFQHPGAARPKHRAIRLKRSSETCLGPGDAHMPFPSLCGPQEFIHDIVSNSWRFPFPLIKFHFAGGDILISLQAVWMDRFPGYLTSNRNVNTLEK